MEKLTDRQFKKETSFAGSRTLLKQWKKAFYKKGLGTPKSFVTDSLKSAESLMTKTRGLGNTRLPFKASR